MAHRLVLAMMLFCAILVFAGPQTQGADRAALLTNAAVQESPISAPPDVVFTLSVVGNQREFHLGELIPITLV
jgi:hypothetical protein